MAEALIGGHGNPAAPLGGARFGGPPAVEEAPPRGMIAVRCDLASDALRDAVSGAIGVAAPERLSIRRGEGGLAAWMSPDELLLIVSRERLGGTLSDLSGRLGEGALVADVSDMRAAFRLSGPGARDVLAKLVPLDLSREGFGPDAFRRTRLAQVPAAIWTEEGGDGFEVVTMRSHARYAFDLLSNAARHGSLGFHR